MYQDPRYPLRNSFDDEPDELEEGWSWRKRLLIFGLPLLVIGIAGFAAWKLLPEPSVITQEPPKSPQLIETAANPLSGKLLYVDPNSNAVIQATRWRTTIPRNSDLLDMLAALPSAKWIADDTALKSLPDYIKAAKAKKAVPVTVSYFIPRRDCGQYSAGGAASEQAYKNFIAAYAKAIGDAPAVVILEPDAIAQLKGNGTAGESCLNDTEQQTRYALLNYAIDAFAALPQTIIYIDAGNSSWLTDTREVAARLTKAGIEKANGFSLNVSNFRTTDETTAYGNEIAKRLNGAHFVIDTSRNGVGPYENPDRPKYNWCNPPGRALGHYPTVSVDDPLVDAYLYIKQAGESDGQDPDPKKCFGGPKAGEWWADYALDLIRRWPPSLQPPQDSPYRVGALPD